MELCRHKRQPADVGTRYTLGDTAEKERVWLRGYPEHSVPDDDVTENIDEFPLVCPDNDREIRPCHEDRSQDQAWMQTL